MENNTQEPKKKNRFHWGHGILVALLAFMAFILALIFYFTQTMQNSELITDNYYQEELEFQKVIDAKNRADELNDIPKVSVETEGIKISFPTDINNKNATFHFYLYRTDDKHLDIKKDFHLEEQNIYTIPANTLKNGSYTLKLMWQKEDKDYQVDYDVLWK